mmetsp:Transcript_40936/g.128553  ORF Transcript_40936/g.128553 Transcript_40936/m.128553 type:complete len:201 (-) Transcript_40936:2099-2701(-)
MARGRQQGGHQPAAAGRRRGGHHPDGLRPPPHRLRHNLVGARHGQEDVLPRPAQRRLARSPADHRHGQALLERLAYGDRARRASGEAVGHDHQERRRELAACLLPDGGAPAAAHAGDPPLHAHHRDALLRGNARRFPRLQACHQPGDRQLCAVVHRRPRRVQPRAGPVQLPQPAPDGRPSRPARPRRPLDPKGPRRQHRV